MRLVNKILLWYLGITALVLAAGGLIVYRSVEKEVDKEQVRELKEWMDDIADRIGRGTPVEKLAKGPVEVIVLDPDAPLQHLRARDTMAMHSQHQRIERHIKASTSYKINGKHYYVSTYGIVVEADDITEAVTKSLTWIFGLFLVFVAITGRVISQRILSPFNKTLKAIQGFHLRQQGPVKLPETKTAEFKELNKFVESTTNKALRDYRSLKEFAENASHEMQTPLAIARGKLELLMESSINDEQAALIQSVSNAIRKLSQMGQSLTLLTKLGNEQYGPQAALKFSNVVQDSLLTFQEMIDMKSISLSQHIDPQVHVRIHPLLADILVTNLLSNAIRHNKEAGAIEVEVTQKGMRIRNTGDAPPVPTAVLFERFKKGNQSGDSIGLGLAIVRQICDLNGFEVTYTYSDGWHDLHLKF